MRLLRIWGVLALLSVHGVVLLLQQLDAGPPWLAELTRFMPWYWLVVPCTLALLLALGLSRWLVAACVLNLALLATLTMGLEWRLVAPQPDSTVRVMSYNVKALNARHKDDGFADIGFEVSRHAPDIVALQDAQHLLPVDSHDELSVAQPIFGLPHVVALGQFVIASKFALSGCSTGRLGNNKKAESQVYLHCQVDLGGKKVDVVTAHFISPREGLMEARNGLLDGMDDWANNLRARYSEAQRLLQVLTRTPRPLLVLGDFNAPEASPVMALLKSAGLRDTFAEAGQGYGYTYGHALGRKTDFLRIDHILVSDGITVHSSTVGGGEASDHSPVVADIHIP